MTPGQRPAPCKQTALTNAASGDEIWVGAGTYEPTTGTDRNATFQLKNGVAVYGGFAMTETQRSQRNPAANVTRLSGDLLGNDSGLTHNDENSYHVVTGASGATLDGFTISGANANGSYPADAGGGMYNYSSSPTLTNVTFSGNTATYGGGLYNNDSSSPTLTNVTFSGNTATNGGGMYNYSSSNPTVRNSILWGDSGGEINNSSSTPTVSNSVVQGGYGGGTNIITTDPLLGAPGSYGGSTNYTASASAAYTQVVNSACTPVSGPDFTFAPAAPRVGEGVTFTGTLSAGTAPITYTWDWGDTTAGGSGAIVLHTFPLTVATQTYTVTLTAGNTCGPAALVQHPVTVQPRRVYLPLILR